MQSMVTAPSSSHRPASSSIGIHSRGGRSTVGDFRVTHNNKCPEMLAAVRRGPFARPTSEERIEYLLTRVHKSSCGVAFAQHALEHTLSFQRRVQAIKFDFLKRCHMTPLGVCHDFWDRTEIGWGAMTKRTRVLDATHMHKEATHTKKPPIKNRICESLKRC